MSVSAIGSANGIGSTSGSTFPGADPTAAPLVQMNGAEAAINLSLSRLASGTVSANSVDTLA